MEAESRRAVRTKIGRVGIFLPGLHAVDLVVIRVELVIVQFVINQFAEQDENCKSDNKISEVDQRKSLVVPDVSENVYEKMFDHGFETVNCFLFRFSVFLI
jgi:hypothetical protein